MVKTEGTYIQVAYKIVFGHISTNSWLFLWFKDRQLGKYVHE